jgi:transcriptional regulator with XRE-family HTH domain
VNGTTARVELKIDALQEYLRKNGLTYAELSRRAGINRSNLHRILNGQRGPGNEVIAKLLNTCDGMRFDDLFIVVPERVQKETNVG